MLIEPSEQIMWEAKADPLGRRRALGFGLGFLPALGFLSHGVGVCHIVILGSKAGG